MIDSTYALGAILAMGVVTFGLRALPFLASKWLQRSGKVQALGRFLPLAIMSLLLLQTTLGHVRDNPNGPWAEIAGIFLTLLLQWYLRQPLLSIFAGTVLYLLLRNLT